MAVPDSRPHASCGRFFFSVMAFAAGVVNPGAVPASADPRMPH